MRWAVGVACGASVRIEHKPLPPRDTPLDPPADVYSGTVSEWIARIGLGHVEGTLQDVLSSLSGPTSLQRLLNFDGDDLDELLELLNLSQNDEATFRREMFKLSGNRGHLLYM